jgi:hypothetical protein
MASAKNTKNNTIMIQKLYFLLTDPTTNGSSVVPRESVPARVKTEGERNSKTEGTNPKTFGGKIWKQCRRIENGLEQRDRDSGYRNVGSLQQAGRNGQNEVENGNGGTSKKQKKIAYCFIFIITIMSIP